MLLVAEVVVVVVIVVLVLVLLAVMLIKYLTRSNNFTTSTWTLVAPLLAVFSAQFIVSLGIAWRC